MTDLLPSGRGAAPAQGEASEESGAGRSAHGVSVDGRAAFQRYLERLGEGYGPRRVVSRGRHTAERDRFRPVGGGARALIGELQRDDLFAEWRLDSDIPIPND